MAIDFARFRRQIAGPTPLAWGFLLLVCVIIGTPVHASDVEVVPAAPTQVDLIRVFVPRGVIGSTGGELNDFNPQDAQVSMVNNRVTISLPMFHSLSGEPSSGLDFAIGQLPPGNYVVEVVRLRPDGSVLSTVGTSSFDVRGRRAGEPLWNHTDMWWDPAESGWGISVTHHGTGKLFAVWYVYGDDHKPIWYVLPDGTWSTPILYKGTAYRTSGPPFVPCGAPLGKTCFDPSAVTVTPAGTMELQFSSYDSQFLGAMFDIDGRTTFRLLQRQPF